MFGLDFPSPVGLAAGFDKNARYLSLLSSLGFGFLEAGTVTPKQQSGNPKPRLFRLPHQEALINRFGFNNDGIEVFCRNVLQTPNRGILGVNIGKNASTSSESAGDDYVHCLRRVADFADYVAVNISSPNTVGLRELQKGEKVRKLLQRLSDERASLAKSRGKALPLVVKIAPDLHDEEVQALAEIVVECGIDGIIATNTTIAREAVRGSRWEREEGGLSGKPLFGRAIEVVRILSTVLRGRASIIACGGIDSPERLSEMMAAGAALCQIYTGFIYHGPRLIGDLVRSCDGRV